MQLGTSSLSPSSTLSFHKPLTTANLEEPALWIATRISPRKTREFFSPDSAQAHLRESLLLAVSFTFKSLFLDAFEVPYIWAHKRDYLCHFDPRDLSARVELLSSSELWRIYSLGQKYRSLVERRSALESSYQKLNTTDEYFENEIHPKIDSVEVVADATEWLAMKYKEKRRDNVEFHFHDDEEQPDNRKRKIPNRISAYEIAKKSVISRLARVRRKP
jgi:transcription elongation factor SPT6